MTGDRLASALPGGPSREAARRAAMAAGAGAVTDGVPLELRRDLGAEAPRLVAAEPLEGSFAARSVGDDDGARVAAFLDGAQDSRAVGHVGPVPIVHGAVGAAIRRRAGRDLATWRRALDAAVYAPRTALPAAAWVALRAGAGGALVDTGRREDRDAAEQEADQDAADGLPAHPFAWTERAYHAVQRGREGLERALAAAWVARPEGVLYVDGGIAGDERVATSLDVLGVVKTHRTLYVPADALASLAALPVGARTGMVRVTSPRRTPVLSWYLRLRDAAGRDPFFGLVRCEIAERPDEGAAARSARADAASRLVLAERQPLALPDPRWGVMAYGIRDCERYLAALMR